MRYADVTLDDGTVVGPVGLHQDQYGVRFYSSDRGRISLLAAAPGMTIGPWGVKTYEHDANGRRTAVHRSASLNGDVPAPIAFVAFRGGCHCGHPLKNYRPPVAWEV